MPIRSSASCARFCASARPILWALMAACDACINLRAPTMGETSGTAVRALALGKPLVVSDVGWFAELPDEVALFGGEFELDSIDVLEIVVGIEKDFGVRISDRAVGEKVIRTPKSIADFVALQGQGATAGGTA